MMKHAEDLYRVLMYIQIYEDLYKSYPILLFIIAKVKAWSHNKLNIEPQFYATLTISHVTCTFRVCLFHAFYVQSFWLSFIFKQGNHTETFSLQDCICTQNYLKLLCYCIGSCTYNNLFTTERIVIICQYKDFAR